MRPASKLGIDIVGDSALSSPSVGHLFCLSRSSCSSHSTNVMLVPNLASVVVEYLYTIFKRDWHPNQILHADFNFLGFHMIFPWSVLRDGFWSILGSSYCN